MQIYYKWWYAKQCQRLYRKQLQLTCKIPITKYKIQTHISLTLKQLETNEYILSTLVTDGMVLKHQAIDINSAGKYSLYSLKLVLSLYTISQNNDYPILLLKTYPCFFLGSCGAFYKQGLTLISAWISNRMLSKALYEITCPSQTSTFAPLKFVNWYEISPPLFYNGRNHLFMLGSK